MADPRSVILSFKPAGPNGTFLPIANGFGDSMAPFIRPNDAVLFKTILPDQIRVGHILAYRPREEPSLVRESLPDRMIVHRVVRKVRVGEKWLLVMKGDNRLFFDPAVLPEQVVGLVTRAGRVDLTRPWRRAQAIGLAWLSYHHATFYHQLRCAENTGGGLRRAWLMLRRRKLVPSNVAGRVVRFARKVLERRPASGGLRRAIARGTRIEAWNGSDAAEAVYVWNQAFPEWATTTERLNKFLFQMPQFNPARCRVLRREGKMLGWGYATRLQRDGEWIHRIEEMAVTPEGWACDGGKLLFRALIAFPLQARVLLSGNLPVEMAGDGLILDRANLLFAEHGFYPVALLTEMTLTRERFAEFQRNSKPAGLLFDFWKEEYGRRIRVDMRVPEYDEKIVQNHLELGGSPERVIVALGQGKLAGVVMALPDQEVRSATHVGGWIWCVKTPERPRGYLMNLVVDEHQRGRGIGSLLVQAAARKLFDDGCSEVSCWTRDPSWFERVGFVKGRSFVRMRLEITH